MMDSLSLANHFESVFGARHSHEYFAPGRINLIGEHIDYNGGSVFPCAITFGTYAFVRQRNDNLIRLYSVNFSERGIISVPLDPLVYDEKLNWANYPLGVIEMIRQEGFTMPRGIDILYYGTIPNGAGLSSSASIEVLTSWILNCEYGFDLSRLMCIKLSQKAENEFIGVNCGIMDQFAVGMGQENSGMLLNTDTLEFEYVPVSLGNASIIIMNTNKRRGLQDSAYNKRREECEQALKIIQMHYSVKHLCDITSMELLAIQDSFDDTTIYRRARHAITENERTHEAKRVLQDGDLRAFGALMNQSHISLRDDYEVTGRELDTLVSAAWKHAGTIGARVTGAGFGGCAIAIVDNQAIDEFITRVGTYYERIIGYEATFYIASIGPGVTQKTE